MGCHANRLLTSSRGGDHWQSPLSYLSAKCCPAARVQRVLVPSPRPSLLEKTGLAQAIGHMLAGYWVRVAVQIPAGRFVAARWQGLDIGQCPSDLFITSELGVARDQEQEAVGVRPDAAS